MLLNDIRLLSQNEISDMKTLDIGCAFGQRVCMFRNQGADAWGIDISEEAVSYGQKYRSLNLLHGSIEDSRLQANSFDCIILIDVIEHLPQPKQVILKCFELLNPGGLLVIYTPNFGCFNRVGDSWAGFKKSYEHILYFNCFSLGYLLKKCGFHIIANKTVDSMPLTEIQTNRYSKFIFKQVLNKILQIVPDKLYCKLRYVKGNFLTRRIRWSPLDTYYHLLLYAQKPKQD